MQTALLATKLHIPPLCQATVPRPRLTAALSKAFSYPLTLLSAPAGYGKTTLVSSWLRETGARAAWLSLDEGDNDPVRFLQYLVAALEKIAPELRDDLSGMVQETQRSPFDARVRLLVDEVASHTDQMVLVLDDLHSIHSSSILEMLSSLVEHLPSQMHLVLLSRTDPQLPLWRLRGRSQLLEIRADQLRFMLGETGQFLNEMMGLSLTADDVAAMEGRTEGWIAGLLMASLALQSRLQRHGARDEHGYISAFAGSHRYIMDYLSEEVLELQPEEVRAFLLRTSILTRMCASLCCAVTGEDSEGPSSAQAVLESLERRNLFVVALDDERRWYRYHHLFGDMLNIHLRQRLPDLVAQLHRRASGWYGQNGFISEAVHHALMAGERDRAARLVERCGCPLLMSGEIITLLSLVESVEPESQARPWLAIFKAWALALTGQMDRVEPALQPAELVARSLEPAGEAGEMLGAISAARAYCANMRGDAGLAAEAAARALAQLPNEGPFACSVRGVTTSVLGDATWMSGDLEGARKAYDDAVTIGRGAGNRDMEIIASCDLGELLSEQGRLQQASRVFSDTLLMSARPDGRTSPLAQGAYLGLSRILYEWNQLDPAEENARRCIELSRQWGITESEAAGWVVLAWIKRAKCQWEGSGEARRAAEQLLISHTLSAKRSIWLVPALDRLWIAGGDLDRALDRVERTGAMLDAPAAGAPIPYHRQPDYITLLRVALARGDHDSALALSDRLLRQVDATNQTCRTLEIHILRALAHEGKRDLERASSALETAFSIARPEGYVRAFLDEGEPVARLLFRAKTRHTGAALASQLLSALAESYPAAPALHPSMPLIDPLSARELEVLKLIHAGYSNLEIAGMLVISVKTAKRHISNIYDKLGAKSRTQALSIGRELRLLE